MTSQRRSDQKTAYKTEESHPLSSHQPSDEQNTASSAGILRGRSPGGNTQRLSVKPDADNIATALNNYNAEANHSQKVSTPRRQLTPLAQPRLPNDPESSQPANYREPHSQQSARPAVPEGSKAPKKQDVSLKEQTGKNISGFLKPSAAAKNPKNEDHKRRQIEAYFGKRPIWIYLSILAGLALIFHPGRIDPLYGFQLALDAPLIAGAILILLGLFWRFFVITFPDDAKIDEWTTQELTRLEAEAIEQMELNEGELLAEPIVFTGYPDISKLRRSFRAGIYGKDHLLRYTPRALTIIVFRENDVLTFEGAVDLTTGARLYDNMSEFFYHDITTVETSRQTTQHDPKAYSRFLSILKPWRWAFIDRINRIITGRHTNNTAQRNSRDVFTLNLVNGQNILTILRDGRMAGDSDYEEIPISLENEVVHLIRELIRQKKNEQVAPSAPSASSALTLSRFQKTD